MMARMQITLQPELQRRARRRADDLGVSLAEYIRRLVARDLGSAKAQAAPSLVFNLGDSGGGSDIAKDKHAMITQAIVSAPTSKRRR